jgi:hypothetical protein
LGGIIQSDGISNTSQCGPVASQYVQLKQNNNYKSFLNASIPTTGIWDDGEVVSNCKQRKFISKLLFNFSFFFFFACF